MLKYFCLIALFAVTLAQNWGWPNTPQDPRPPTWIDPQPPNWNQPQAPGWPQPQPPNWNQPQPQPDSPDWSRPSNRPTHPINTQGRIGVRDTRCPAFNGDFVVLFPHERFCSQYYICNHGLRCKQHNSSDSMF